MSLSLSRQRANADKPAVQNYMYAARRCAIRQSANCICLLPTKAFDLGYGFHDHHQNVWQCAVQLPWHNGMRSLRLVYGRFEAESVGRLVTPSTVVKG